MSVRLGQKAPDFKLPDQNGKIHQLSDDLGRWLLIYFYPRDNTPGCTKEACAMRDNFASFKKLNTKILGVSQDSQASHQKFIKSQRLPFDLLADEDKTMLKTYGAWGKKKMMGREYMGIKRISYLVDPTGKIAKIYKMVKPAEHAKQVLAEINKLTTK